MTEEQFWKCTPHRLQTYIKAYKERANELDAIMWNMGVYVQRAVMVGVDSVLNGRKSRAKYFEKPIHMMREDSKYYDASQLSESEKQALRDKLVRNLKAMEKSHNEFVGKKKG